jgi:hypothetical protein
VFATAHADLALTSVGRELESPPVIADRERERQRGRERGREREFSRAKGFRGSSAGHSWTCDEWPRCQDIDALSRGKYFP